MQNRWGTNNVILKEKLKCFTISLDQFDDELPCFSLNELWNDDELALTLNVESDPHTSPQELHLRQKRNKSLHPLFFDVAAPENRQKISLVERPMPRSSRFKAESKARVNSCAPLFLGSSQSNRHLRRIPLPVLSPPPTPEAEDFDLTGYSGSARGTCSSYWNKGQLNLTSTGRMKPCSRLRSPPEDPYDVPEAEDWNILPVVSKPEGQTNALSSKKKTENETNLLGSQSSTTLDTPSMQGSSCLQKENVIAVEDECTQRYQQRYRIFIVLIRL